MCGCVFVLLRFMVKYAIREGDLLYLKPPHALPILWSKYKPDKIPSRRACEHGLQSLCVYVCVCVRACVCACVCVLVLLPSSSSDAYEK